MKRKVIKIVSILLICVVLVGGAGGGLFWYFTTHSNSKPVDVEPVRNNTTEDWGSQNYSYGIATSDFVQELYPETDKIIQEICVKEGQEVKAGDVLIRYDTTKMQLEVERAENDLQQLRYQIETGNKDLAHIQSLKPYVPMPEPEPEPEPPLPERQAELCETVNSVSQSFSGNGTEEEPYRFLCTQSSRLDPEFLGQLMGNEDDPLNPVEPAYARFEIHEEDNENGLLLYGWALDGAQGISFLEQEIPEEPEPEPLPVIPEEPGEQYTKEELDQMIAAKRQEITSLEYSVKQAELSLESAKQALENASVVSKIDGVVKTLVDTDEVIGTGKPFLVVSGGNGFYIQGTLSEALIGQISVGDYVEANSWETGNYYQAQIIDISDYPEENGDYYGGSSNPNSSNYRFTAVIEDTEGLTNGTYLDITINVPGETESGFFLWKGYVRSDNGEKYVYKVGEDGRLHRQPVSIGRILYGEYIEIKSGLTEDEYIAFPYGKNVKEGAAVNMPEDEFGEWDEESDAEAPDTAKK